MNNLVNLIDGKILTTSRIVSEEFERRHDDVLKSIRAVIKRGNIGVGGLTETSYIDKSNRQQPMFEMGEREFLKLAPFIGGEKAEAGQDRLVDAFMDLREKLILNKPPETMLTALESAVMQEKIRQVHIEGDKAVLLIEEDTDEKMKEIAENALKRRIKNRLEIADMLGQSFDINEFLTNEKSTLDPKVIMDMKLTMGKEIATYGTLDLKRSSLGHLLDLHSIDKTAQAFNRDILIPIGMLSDDRVVMEKGLYFGSNDVASSVADTTHPRWFDARFAELIEYVKGENLL